MITDKSILGIKDFESLVDFLVDELGWPLDPDKTDYDELAYSYSPEELGLDEKFATKINSIRQLRPDSDKLHWGVFWIDFENKRLPITVLRRILRSFVTKKRSQNPNQKTWELENLLFVSGHGDIDHRGLTFAHFKRMDGIDEIRDFSWDQSEKHFIHYAKYLDKLKWPDDENSIEKWQEQWNHAFLGSTRLAIRTAKELAEEMAFLARDIRKRVQEVFDVEIVSGPLHKLYNSFRDALFHEMTTAEFADMYAQTITYGLFSARCMDKDGVFEIDKVINKIPPTNPFLKNLFKECFQIGEKNTEIDLDEIGVTRLVELLDSLNRSDGTDIMQRILEEFGRQTGGGSEDPVIHFYEGFLNHYESEQRKRRGVYYTPDPIVSFIVRSVHEILKDEFGLKLGLADSTTWGEMIDSGRIVKPKINDRKQETRNEEWRNQPFVQIFDPATGTGTFLKHTIDLIHKEIETNFNKSNKNEKIWVDYWNTYVDENLLPRLYGFELMMAPYSVAHMKLGLFLRETGYKFEKDKRINIYLTNSLEQGEQGTQTNLFIDAIGKESESAKEIKQTKLFPIVIGNPPYSGNSANKGEWIKKLMEDYKIEPEGKEKLKERNSKFINDDYMKFLRYGQHFIQKNRCGVLAFINPHGFLDNPTFRGMRWNLLKTYDKIYTIDLHGNSKKKETAIDGSADANVFDIMQGVSINVFVKNGRKDPNELGKVFHFDLLGKREMKYNFLIENKLNDISFKELMMVPPFYFFIEKDYSVKKDYDLGFSLSNLFSKNSLGIQTHRDSFAISIDKKSLTNRIKDFYDKGKSNQDLISKYNIKETSEWKLEKNRKGEFDSNLIVKINYRLFDTRYIYYSNNIIDRGRNNIMQHITKANIALTVSKQQSSSSFRHLFLSKNIQESCLISLQTKEGGYTIPLYLYPESNGQQTIDQTDFRTPNLNTEIVKQISKNLKLTFTNEKEVTTNTIAPIDILDYIYAVLHSPTYREKYKEFLKIDFPRVPYPKDKNTFWKLVNLGGELRQIHLLESTAVEKYVTHFPIDGDNSVTKPKYKEGKVFINTTQYFDNVPEVAWNFYIGGYQPAQKWLKDRKKRILTYEDINHYQKIIVALTETDRIMKEIDKIDFE